MHVFFKMSTMDDIRLIIQLLEQLRIEHAHQKIEGTVVVRDDSKDSCLFLPDLRQFHFIILGDTCQRFQVELFQSGYERNLDGFQRLASPGAIVPVVFQCYVFLVSHLQLVEQKIQRRLEVIVFLLHLSRADHVQDHREILLLRRCLIMQIEYQCQ